MKPEARNWVATDLGRRLRLSRVRREHSGGSPGSPVEEGYPANIQVVSRAGGKQDQRAVLLVLLPLVLCCAPITSAQENVRLTCTPRTFHVLPGQPVRLQLTVQADSAASVRLHIPADPLLWLRAVEKLPVQRTPEGVIVHKRVIIWQPLEPGTVNMTAISVEMLGRKWLFPGIMITVSDPGP